MTARAVIPKRKHRINPGTDRFAGRCHGPYLLDHLDTRSMKPLDEAGRVTGKERNYRHLLFHADANVFLDELRSHRRRIHKQVDAKGPVRHAPQTANLLSKG